MCIRWLNNWFMNCPGLLRFPLFFLTFHRVIPVISRRLGSYVSEMSAFGDLWFRFGYCWLRWHIDLVPPPPFLNKQPSVIGESDVDIKKRPFRVAWLFPRARRMTCGVTCFIPYSDVTPYVGGGDKVAICICS